jgi:hypothetical protein
MSTKTAQLQIRVTPRQKAMLKRRARAAGLDLSTFVLARTLPEQDDRLTAIVRALGVEANPRFALAELNDFLHACPRAGFADAVEHVELGALTPYLQNYVAAMTEQAAHQKGVAPPEWTRDIAPLDAPRFATPLASLRAHLLRASPVPFKRRNIFVDAGVGSRV